MFEEAMTAQNNEDNKEHRIDSKVGAYKDFMS